MSLLIFCFESQKRKSEEIQDTRSPSPKRKSRTSPVKKADAKTGRTAAKGTAAKPRTAVRRKKPVMTDTATSP